MCNRPQLATAAEMAAALGLKESTWRDVARRRGYPCFRIAHAVRWDLTEILALVREDADERRHS